MPENPKNLNPSEQKHAYQIEATPETEPFTVPLLNGQQGVVRGPGKIFDSKSDEGDSLFDEGLEELAPGRFSVA